MSNDFTTQSDDCSGFLGSTQAEAGGAPFLKSRHPLLLWREKGEGP